MKNQIACFFGVHDWGDWLSVLHPYEYIVFETCFCLHCGYTLSRFPTSNVLKTTDQTKLREMPS